MAGRGTIFMENLKGPYLWDGEAFLLLLNTKDAGSSLILIPNFSLALANHGMWECQFRATLQAIWAV